MEEFATLYALIPLNPGIFAVIETCKAVGDYLKRFGFLSNGNYIAGRYTV